MNNAGEIPSEMPNDCDWCDTPLEWSNDVGGQVCIKCYNLLIGSSIPHEKIFEKRDAASSDG